MNWIKEAAEEIARQWPCGSGRDDYITDEQRAVILQNLVTIIASHCPFEEGTAYLMLDEVRAILTALKRGECWCEMGIGNPMVTSHDEGCRFAQNIMNGAYTKEIPPYGTPGYELRDEVVDKTIMRAEIVRVEAEDEDQKRFDTICEYLSAILQELRHSKR